MEWTIERKYRNRQIRAYRRICKKTALFVDEFFVEKIASNPEYYGEILDPATFPTYKKRPSKRRIKKPPHIMQREEGIIRLLEQIENRGWEIMIPVMHERVLNARKKRIENYFANGGKMNPAPLFD